MHLATVNKMTDAYHLKLKHPFTCMVAGSTGSGKTILVRNILKNYSTTTTIRKSPLRVLYYYGQPQSLFSTQIASDVQVQYVHVRSSTDFDAGLVKSTRPDVVIIDDLMIELGGNEDLSNMFTKSSHHLNISVFFIVQNLYHKGREARNLSLNSHYLIIFKNARDKSQVEHLARQLSPSNVKGFREMFEDATKEPFSYLLIDCKPDTPEELRFRSKVTPDEDIKGSPKGSMMIYKI